jgi:hypothetical protein
LRPHHSVGIRAEARRLGLTRLRLVEIGVAVLLTVAALLFVGLAVWTADEIKIHEDHAKVNLD